MKTIARMLQMVLVGGSVVIISACAVPSGTNASRGGYGSGAMASGAGGYGGFGGKPSALAMEQAGQDQTIYFAYDRSEIEPWALQPVRDDQAHEQNPAPTAPDVVNAEASYLLQHSEAKIRLEGNTDERGSREYNIALGERRAQTVANALKMSGVQSNQVSVISYGKEKPVALGNDEGAYSQNRRVNLKFSERG